ncbi:MAG TPA: RNA methyltransferase [Bacteroidales bacterium]|nr:RNA methyltransferase [Bacteroidales bacterium]
MRKLSLQELNRLSPEEYKTRDKHPVVVVLDNIRSANNTGSFFRTSDAFAIEKIFLCGITASPPHRDIQKTAIGATNSVDWEYVKSTVLAVQELKAKGYQIISVEQCDGSLSLDSYSVNDNIKTAYVFGNEVSGVSQEIIDLSDSCLEIPQWGTKHSLNVSVSAGIVLWNHVSQLNHLPKK